ncbi:hypothetical protein V8C42DRAFT_318393 [Trichoderma barbatum]
MKFFTAISLLLAAANATPVDLAESNSVSLEKRDTEIIYLTNCEKRVSAGEGAIWSEVIYYPASGQANGQLPPSQNTCLFSTGNYVTWEGQSHSCRFSSGVTFTSHIDGGSHSFPNYSGTGNNGKNWNCYRDNGRKIFTNSGPEWSASCYSVYYCLP